MKDINPVDYPEDRPLSNKYENEDLDRLAVSIGCLSVVIFLMFIFVLFTFA